MIFIIQYILKMSKLFKWIPRNNAFELVYLSKWGQSIKLIWVLCLWIIDLDLLLHTYIRVRVCVFVCVRACVHVCACAFL